MNREEAEKRALELYPVKMVERSIPKHVGRPFEYEEDDNERPRKAYLQCFDDLSKSKDITKTCGYCVEPKNQEG